jgi:hypothetical protein
VKTGSLNSTVRGRFAPSRLEEMSPRKLPGKQRRTTSTPDFLDRLEVQLSGWPAFFIGFRRKPGGGEGGFQAASVALTLLRRVRPSFERYGTYLYGSDSGKWIAARGKVLSEVEAYFSAGGDSGTYSFEEASQLHKADFPAESAVLAGTLAGIPEPSRAVRSNELLKPLLELERAYLAKVIAPSGE